MSDVGSHEREEDERSASYEVKDEVQASPARNGHSPSPKRRRSRSRSKEKRRSVDRRSSRKRSAERSRSPRRHKQARTWRSSRRSRTKSRSLTPPYRSSRRGGRSPPPRRGGGGGGGAGYREKEDPSPNRCLGVFGLSLYTNERDLRDHFGKFGTIDQIQLVYDHPTGRSRGFGFIYFENLEDSIEAKEQCAGIEMDGHRIRVDYSVTRRPHTPTPGVYMGRPTMRGRGGGREGGGGRDGGRDSGRRPVYEDNYRGRSRSYSPRKEYY